MRRSSSRLLETFQRSRVGRFVGKFLDDRGIELAMVVAWGTLSTVFPVLLGITSMAGLLLQDPARSGQVSGVLLQLVPAEAAAPLSAILDDTRRNAGGLGIIGIVLLLFNGSNLFSNMESVFNRAYHVPDRPFLADRLTSVWMLLIVITLALVSTLAYSLGGFLGTASDALLGMLPVHVPGSGLAALLLGYVVSIVSAGIMFLLLYTILPNKRQSVKQALPGALTAALLFFVILQAFPLYTLVFGKGFETYAVFGMLLLLMFWTFLLGIVLVLGAELNAFLEGLGPAVVPGGQRLDAAEGHTVPDPPLLRIRPAARRRRSRRH